MKLFKIVLPVLLTLLSAFAMARTSVPIVNFDDVAVSTGSNAKLSAAQVGESIKTAAQAKTWTVSPAGDNKMTATLQVRGKHTVVIEIPYSATSYSLLYKDSSNMKHEVEGGTPVIHPFYNKWVATLKDGIQMELQKR
jgi:hypothetical protein